MTSEPVRVPAEGFLEGRLQAVLDVKSVDGIVRHYLQGPPTTGFAGKLFDTLGKNPCGEITADDVAAVSLLDVRFGPRALHALVEQNAADDLLALVPDEVDLWEAEVEDLRSRALVRGSVDPLAGPRGSDR